MEKSVGEESCREVLGRSVVETCWKRVLEKRVGEEGCREESCREVLEKSVVEKAALEKSARRVGCCSFFAVAVELTLGWKRCWMRCAFESSRGTK